MTFRRFCLVLNILFFTFNLHYAEDASDLNIPVVDVFFGPSEYPANKNRAYKISSDFGTRQTDGTDVHQGIDVGVFHLNHPTEDADIMTPLYAIESGKIWSLILTQSIRSIINPKA